MTQDLLIPIIVSVVASAITSIGGGAITVLVTIRVFGERLRRAEADIIANHSDHSGEVHSMRGDISALRSEVGGVKSDVSYIRGRLEPRDHQ